MVYRIELSLYALGVRYSMGGTVTVGFVEDAPTSGKHSAVSLFAALFSPITSTQSTSVHLTKMETEMTWRKQLIDVSSHLMHSGSGIWASTRPGSQSTSAHKVPGGQPSSH